jgi:3-oxoacyl-ACP reductase-like protein
MLHCDVARSAGHTCLPGALPVQARLSSRPEGNTMSIFGKIMSTLGMGDDKPATPAPAAKPAAAPAPVAAAVAAPAAVVAAPPVTAITVIDVVAQLSARAASHAEPLNWQTSIVDLLKLLGLDSSLAERKALAQELGCPADKLADSAQMNTWLHKSVLQKLAANGGNIPANLLD